MLQPSIFILFVVIFLIVGSRFAENKNIQPFLTLALLLPFTPSLSIIHFRYQINSYSAFLVFPLLVYGLNRVSKNRINVRTLKPLIYTSLFLVTYLIISPFLSDFDVSTINILKDMKPFILVVIGFIFLDIIKGKQIEWEGAFSKKMVKINFFVSLLFFIMITNTNLIGVIAEDPFYKISVVRYLTLGTFFVFFYFLAKLATNSPISFTQLIYILTPIFLSGNRTLFFILTIIVIVNLLMSITNIQKFLKRLTLLLIGSLSLVIGVLNFNPILKNRLLSALDFDLVMEQLLEYRFVPFLTAILDFKWFNFILGKGIGQVFFIPWFVWRKNIDNYNIYFDNLYLTLYTKYGVMSLFFFYTFFKFIASSNTNRKFKIFVSIYFIIIGLTTAYAYQYTFLMLILLIAIFKMKKKIKHESWSLEK